MVLNIAKINESQVSGVKDIEFSVVFDTPRILLHGAESESAGYIVNGSIVVRSNNSGVKYVNMGLVNVKVMQKIHYSKPFLFSDSIISPCGKCNTKFRSLLCNNIIEAMPLFFDQDCTKNTVPFSILIPGNVSPTTLIGLNSQTSIDYEMVCKFKYTSNVNPKLQRTVIEFPVTILRAHLQNINRTYLRSFYPLKINATVIFPDVIYPKSLVPLEIRINGLRNNFNRWKVKKIHWDLLEYAYALEDVCLEHKPLYEELKLRINSSRNHLVLQTAKCAKLEVKKVATTEIVAGSLSEIVGASIVDDEVLNNQDYTYHPLDPENPRNHAHLQPPTEYKDTLTFTEKRTIAEGDIRSGWKTEPDAIHLIRNLDLQKLRSPGLNAHFSQIGLKNMALAYQIYNNDVKRSNCACDITIQDHSSSTIDIHHTLELTIEISEEQLQNEFDAKEGTKTGFLTGEFRTLRAEFKVILAERPGHSLSWVEEAPPLYCVGTSPPTYTFS